MTAINSPLQRAGHGDRPLASFYGSLELDMDTRNDSVMQPKVRRVLYFLR
jgi:hypothetical protein